MPATTAMTVFLTKDRHGSGDATSCSIREASRCDMASLPAALVPGWGRTGLLGFVVLLRRHRRIVTGGERGSA